jgi:hypothetical protein
MNTLKLAEAGAQFFSLFAYSTIAIWYVAPRLNALPRAEALTPLLWVHAFRYLSLQTFGLQQDGFPISDRGVLIIVIGYITGAVIAFATLFALRYRARFAIPLAWLLVIETVVNAAFIIRNGVSEQLFGEARAAGWLAVCFYVPLVMVSLALLIWQLYSRRGEALSTGRPSRDCGHSHQYQTLAQAGAIARQPLNQGHPLRL